MIKIHNTRPPYSYLFTYFHFMFNCLIPEITNNVYEYKKVYRIKNENQTIGNFSKIYEEVTGCENIEISQEEYEKLDIKMIQVNFVNYTHAFNPFRTFIFNRYSIQPDLSYPEIILIKRDDAQELVDNKILSNRIYNTGKKKREITEIEILEKYLKETFEDKFKPIILENMNFKEQIKYFYNAKMIIGCHGAAFANLVFCKKDTIIIEVMHQNIQHHCIKIFPNISKVIELKHFQVEDKIEKIKEKIKENF